MNEKGYAKLAVDGKDVRAHRYAYEQAKGLIPVDRELDHLCRVRFCVNPDHLEAVTHGENIRRGKAARAAQRLAWDRATLFVEEHASNAHRKQRENARLLARSVDDRFFDSYREEPNTGCWIWIEQVDPNGYGRFFDGKRSPLAHRFSYKRAKGRIQRGRVVHHTCGLRSCVNPVHLDLITRKESRVRSGCVGPRPPRATCKNGHDLAEGVNTYYRTWRQGKYSGTTRCCLTCQQEQQAQATARKRDRRRNYSGQRGSP